MMSNTSSSRWNPTAAAVIVITWFVLIVNGVLVSTVFRRRLRDGSEA